MGREKLIQVRVDEDELARINRRARAAGLDRSAYLRQLGLGERQLGASIEVGKAEHPEPEATAVDVQDVRIPPTATAADVRVGAEIAEARMDDDAAREAFLKRRTKELSGRHTTPVARRMAAEEWAAR